MNAIIEAPRLLTPDDLLALPDGGKGYELIDGVLVEQNMSEDSSEVGMTIGRALGNVAHPPAWPPSSARTSDIAASPAIPTRSARRDVSVILRGRRKGRTGGRGVSPVAPGLAVEGVSPNDLFDDVEERSASTSRRVSGSSGSPTRRPGRSSSGDRTARRPNSGPRTN